MTERFLRKHIYVLGMFYQIDSFNPVFLDKTGELITKTDGKLKNWNGGIEGFEFVDSEELISGKINMQNYWYQFQKQGDFEESSINKFGKFISHTNSLISDVYQPGYFNRIGLRLQYILKKTTVEVKDKYKHQFDTCFSKLNKYGSFSTTAIGFEVMNDDYNIKVNVNYAKRNTNNDPNAPKEGLLIDLDFYKKLDKAILKDIDNINNVFLEHVITNYEDVICCIAQEMGVANER